MPKGKIPTYYQTHPPDLATIEALRLAGLQSADGQRVAAVFKLRTGDREHLSGIYRRADAVPLQVKKNTSACSRDVWKSPRPLARRPVPRPSEKRPPPSLTATASSARADGFKSMS
ncbi:hypothetical protein [Deinococcus sp. QL22]|uniref:hypothetical protein n=1 Tax=Deinococcus sp. QL22 TaxID=2939437 RepID=UPI002016F1AD|nr:hypothetical protein [Deinococcus sp. QL22]